MLRHHLTISNRHHHIIIHFCFIYPPSTHFYKTNGTYVNIYLFFTFSSSFISFSFVVKNYNSCIFLIFFNLHLTFYVSIFSSLCSFVFIFAIEKKQQFFMVNIINVNDFLIFYFIYVLLSYKPVCRSE